MSLVRPVVGPDEWVLAAACRGSGDLFFAPDALESKIERRRREAAAKEVCRACPVQAECLEEALTQKERFGIWGGTTERERKALIARRRMRSPQDIAGPGRPLSLPAVAARGRPMSHDLSEDPPGQRPGG